MTSRWLTESLEKLAEYKSSDEMLLNKFLEMGLPVLKKCKSGFIAEMGDIVTCLLVHIDDSKDSTQYSLRVEICNIDDTGQLQSRVKANGDLAAQVIKSYLNEYPSAVMTTSGRKPLCLFSKKIDRSETKTGKETGKETEMNSLGIFSGYMSFLTFKRIVSDQSNKITVAVP
jgi:hypothetical protein